MTMEQKFREGPRHLPGRASVTEGLRLGPLALQQWYPVCPALLLLVGTLCP